MNLSELYESLSEKTPKTEFRELIRNECGVAEMTLYRWLNGTVTPDKLKREKISQVTGISVEELFPKVK